MNARRHSPRYLTLLLTILWTSAILFAGGPNRIGADGQAQRWDPARPVNFKIDRGSLGFLSNDKAADLVRSSAELWEEVPTSTIAFQDLGFLDVDVTAVDWSSFLKSCDKTPEGGIDGCPENPVIFDHDGGITDDLLGFGANRNVIGFAGVRYIDPAQAQFISGWAVLNGKKSFDPPSVTFRQAVVHELGHLLGLDHTQGMKENALAHTQFGKYIPLMYPIVYPEGLGKPIRDEISWVSWLYPEPDFGATTGTITGKVFRRSGAPMQGSNVVATLAVPNGDGTYTESREEVVSVVSDFLMGEDGSFELPGLVPGQYFVYIDPLRDEFTEGSGVGPFDTRPTAFPKDYFDPNESAQEDPKVKTLITVGAGEVVTDINLVANELANRLDLLGDDDEMLYEFPAGFSFPFFGKVYSQVVVNSDGNLTFEVGDGKVGSERSELRFLSGPPRIAPFFSDLDPSAGGAVRAETGAGFVKFIWDNVPEFDDEGTPPGNTFSVTLFSSGSIRFSFDSLQATPDPDLTYPAGLLAVVGISPGSLGLGNETNFSEGNGSFEMGASPIYEVFPGNSFDLNGQEINFLLDSHDLYFPFYRGDSQNFTGYAITNYGTSDAALQVEGFSTDGTLLPYPKNPAALSLPARSQEAKLGSELFGISASVLQAGWIRMRSSSPEVASFFQFGNGMTGDLTRMDGSVAFTSQAKKLFFTRLYHGNQVYPALTGGPKDAVTSISVANPNSEPIRVVLNLVQPSGFPVAQPVTRDIPGYGYFIDNLASLFKISGLRVLDGYVSAEVVQGEGAVGFELIELPDTLLGFNASFENPTTVLYSGQLAHGVDIFTSIKLVNPTAAAIPVTLRGYFSIAGGGIEQRVAGPLGLGAGQSFQVDAGQLFGFLAQPTPTAVGSFVVEASSPGIVGDVIFGDPHNAVFAAALPLQTQPFKEAVFSQVANGPEKPAKPSFGAFTGLALFNPNQTAAEVIVEVYDRNGNQIGLPKSVPLGPRARISQLLEELVPASASLIRGFVVVKSDQPIVAQELFGNDTLEFLSAVPPTVVQ